MTEPIPNPIKPKRSLREWCKERGLDLFITLGGMVAVLLATVYLHFWAPPSLTKNTKVVVIPQGRSFHEIAQILEEQGIIRDRRSFYLLARIEGSLSKVKAGEYEVHTQMTPSAVLSKLLRGEVIQYPIVIPEGYNIYQIGDILEQTKVCSKKLFLEKVQDPDLIQSLAMEGDSLEGYLFPDTYNFPKGLGEEQVIRQMVSRFKTVWSSLAKRAEVMGLSRRDVVILGSMIEKEAKDDQERRFIAAVFHNRLNRGMALQSDPTAIYGLKEKRSSITRGDLQRRTPYNTYIISGLPKGPIANPGFKSLQAVLNPAEVSYLYFVSRNDGTHFFSSTLQEHNLAVAKYQRKGKK
jgi:UPF0755 protein